MTKKTFYQRPAMKVSEQLLSMLSPGGPKMLETVSLLSYVLIFDQILMDEGEQKCRDHDW
jgi:hypothetical protein